MSMYNPAFQSTSPAYLSAASPSGPSALPGPGFSGDPIKLYGQQAATYLLDTVRQVPAEFRDVALEAVLDEVEPGLVKRVQQRRRDYERRGMSSVAAVRAALASSMSQGLAQEFVKIGRKGAPALRSQLGLGYYGEPALQVTLDGLWSKIKKGAKKVSRGVKKAGRTVGRTAKRGARSVSRAVKKTGRAVGRGVKKAGRAIKDGAKQAWKWGKKAVNKLGSMACGVLQSPVAPMAAGVAAAAYGVPPQVGAAGAQAGAKLCKPKDAPPTLAPPVDPAAAAQTGTFPVVPVALGGAALLGVFLLTRK